MNSKLTMDTSVIRRIILAFIILIVMEGIPATYAQEDYTPSELSFIVYSDGYIGVDYTIDVDPTLVQVNVTLFGDLYLDMLIEDQDGTGLDYTSITEGITIDTIGSITAYISYFTTDLTSKDGQIWSLNVSTPISLTILFPENTAIMNYNIQPNYLGSLNGNPYVIMPSGVINIEYTIGPVGTREHAQTLINDAENTIDTIKAEGILVPLAESKLQQAKDYFDDEKYIEAEQYASQAKTTAQETQTTANNAQNTITQAESAISSATNAGRTVGLDTAQILLDDAEASYELGNYSEAQDFADQAISSASNSTKPEESDGGIPYTWIFGGLGLAVLAVGGYLYTRQKQDTPVQSEMKKVYDLDKLMSDFPHLRVDDKEVLRYIASKGGEAFAAEIRDRFEIPRTSLWRMIRRLEGEEVIEVDNIGGQSLVRLSSKYVSEGR